MKTIKTFELPSGMDLLRVSDMTSAIQAIDFDNAWNDAEKRELYKSWLKPIVLELATFIKNIDREGELRKYTERQNDVIAIAQSLKKYIDNERHEHEIDYLRYETKDHGKKLYKQIGTFIGLIASGVFGAVIQEISSENGGKVGNIIKRFANKFSEIFSDYPTEMTGGFFIVMVGIYLNWKIKEIKLNKDLSKFLKPGNDEMVWNLLANMHQLDEDVRRRYVVLGRMLRRIIENRQKDAEKEAIEFSGLSAQQSENIKEKVKNAGQEELAKIIQEINLLLAN
jgi:hypothetical protein